VHSRSVVAEGGLIRRLFEMSYGSGFGCAIDLPWDPLKSLFAELNAAMILVVDPASPWERYLARGDYVPLGVVTEEPEIAVHVEGERLFKVLPDAIATEWKRTFAEVVE
jgi:phosphoribosylformylglycinamidine (FGAM) synthase-like enzyme